MSQEKSGYLVLSIMANGKKFRPSDWIERIASNFATFERKRLRYDPMVAPVRLNDQAGLFVNSELMDSNPEGYDYVIDFAHKNHLQIIPINQPDLPTSPIELQHVA